MAIPGELNAQQLLDAMDGIVYLIDADGIILAVGGEAWRRFAEENSAPWLAPESVVGTSIFSHIHGGGVQDTCRKLHDAVCQERRPAVTYGYRCDAPDAERRMRMSISPVRDRSGSVMALYQSQVVTEAPRLPLGLVSMERRASAHVAYRREQFVAFCSFCQDLAWPIGAEEPDQIWIKIDEYYRRGGSTDVVVSHGVCPACLARLLAPNT